MPRGSRRYRLSSQARDAQNAIWLIGLGVLFFTGRWWPGILIVIGVSMVVGALVRRLELPDAPPPPLASPPPPAPAPAGPAAPIHTVPPAPRPRRLPDQCPYCGAPPRSLPQRDINPNLCPFCGSDLSAEAQ